PETQKCVKCATSLHKTFCTFDVPVGPHPKAGPRGRCNFCAKNKYGCSNGTQKYDDAVLHTLPPPGDEEETLGGPATSTRSKRKTAGGSAVPEPEAEVAPTKKAKTVPKMTPTPAASGAGCGRVVVHLPSVSSLARTHSLASSARDSSVGSSSNIFAPPSPSPSLLEVPRTLSPTSSAHLDRNQRSELLTALRGALTGIRTVEDNLRKLEHWCLPAES
ncbi:hypothetical protein M378DRAFT_18198, partial [Amanita muscaria Koide BX008]